MKKIVNTIALCSAFILLTINASLLAEGGLNSITNNEGKTNWIQFSKARKTIVPAFFDFDIEAKVSDTGIGYVLIRIKNRTEIADCCGWENDKNSWCDAGLQDKRC